jgi:hypothetical protein
VRISAREMHALVAVLLSYEIIGFCLVACLHGDTLFDPLNAEFNPICHLLVLFRTFNVYGYVHRKYIPIYIQRDATLHSSYISGKCSTYFGWYFHPSSGAHTNVSTASGICHTGLRVLWVPYATHSSLKAVPTLPR